MMLRVHSIQSLGTLDGPGVRFVVFLQGCHLRCKCCHNPDTWDILGGSEMQVEELFEKVQRYKEYFGEAGGITLSGGEPLLQPRAAHTLFSLCKKAGINTCLDTSGAVLNHDVKELLSVTDRVLLDIKYTNEAAYRENVGCSLSEVLDFLSLLDEMKIQATLRQVIIPTLNSSEGNIKALKAIKDAHKCVDSIELLPFRKLCETKYSSLSIPFPFQCIPEPTREQMEKLNSYL